MATQSRRHNLVVSLSAHEAETVATPLTIDVT